MAKDTWSVKVGPETKERMQELVQDFPDQFTDGIGGRFIRYVVFPAVELIVAGQIPDLGGRSRAVQTFEDYERPEYVHFLSILPQAGICYSVSRSILNSKLYR